MKKIICRTLAALTGLLLVATPLAPARAQRRRADAPAPPTRQPARTAAADAEACDVWTGAIEITRHRTESHTKVSAEGQHLSDQHHSGTNVTSSSYDYRAAFKVAASSGSTYEDGSKSLTLKGTVSAAVLRVDEEKDDWKTKTDCFPDTPAIRVAGKNSTSKITERGELAGAGGDGVMQVRGGQYRISFGVPEIAGTRVHRTTVKPFGWCMAEANPPHDGTEESAVSFSSESVTLDGRIDPKNPDLLQGSAQPDPETTITWSLARRQGECEGALKVNGVWLAHHVFPNPTEWQEVGEKTVDGNQVRITATVANDSKKPKSGTVVFRETRSGEVLGERPVSVPAGGEAEVELLWDTNGYAWTDGGQHASAREIEARVGGESQTAEVTVVPKPVVLVHGLWSNGAAWSDYHNYLEEAHSYAWKAYAVGADPRVAQMNTGDSAGNMEPTFSIRQNAQELGKQVRHTQRVENAWRIDLVAHSMGGLISRFYIHHSMTSTPDGVPTVAHLVMLGTPNMGSPCADLMYPAYKALGFEVEALRQLRPSVVAEFNAEVTDRKGVKFSILAGVPVPRTCQEKTWGDGVVEIPSALWQVADRAYAPRVHTEITGREDFFAFVRPRLAVGPKRAQSARLDEAEGREYYARGGARGHVLIASLDQRALLSSLLAQGGDGGSARVVVSKALKIAAGGAAELPVEFAGAGSGVSFVAPPDVKVSLVNADGEVEQMIEAGGAEAAQTFKTFYAAGAGRRTLRFENAGERPANAVAAVWDDPNPLALEFVELQRRADGSVKMQARLTSGGAAVGGAVVRAKVDGRAPEITLLDDGRSGDGAAGDGIYGAASEILAGGEHLIEARASAGGASARASALLSVGQ